MPYVIGEQDYLNHIWGKPGNLVVITWQEIIKGFTPELQKEASEKEFSLKPHPLIQEDGLSKPFIFNVTNGSAALKDELTKLENVINLIKD